MLWSSEMTGFVIGVYLVLGGGIGALVGLAFGLASRGHFSFKHFLYSCGLGVVGSGFTLVVLGRNADGVARNVNGLLAELFGAEIRVGDLLLFVGPASIAVLGCVVMTALAYRESHVRA